MYGRTYGRTDVQIPPVFYRTSSPSGPQPKNDSIFVKQERKKSHFIENGLAHCAPPAASKVPGLATVAVVVVIVVVVVVVVIVTVTSDGTRCPGCGGCALWLETVGNRV